MDSLGLPADMMVIVLNMLSHDINQMFSLNNTFLSIGLKCNLKMFLLFVIFMSFKERLYPKSQTTKRRTTLFSDASRNGCFNYVLYFGVCQYQGIKKEIPDKNVPQFLNA